MTMRSWIRNLFARPVTRPLRKAPQRFRPALETLEDRWVPSTFVVNNPTDTIVAGETDLRQAIASANSTPGANTIAFDSTVFASAQTITLGGTQLEMSNTSGTETITGPAAGVTVNGGGLSRVFQVDTLVTASISGLTITGGNAGTGYTYGGGLYNLGTSTLTNCTVSGNSAGWGGGLAAGTYFNRGASTTLTNCTVSGNSGEFVGGIYSSGALALTNCTVSGNSAGISGIGGVDTYFGTATLGNTIVAGNTAGFAPDVGGAVTSQGNNLVGATGGSSGWVGSDLTGTSAMPVNAELAPLGNYGGPTQTMPLLPDSPAIDAGSNALIPAGITTDQRGDPRIVNGTVDIGAFESQGFTITVVPGSTPQTAVIGTPFANPLAVIVTANNPVEPVNGGVVSFVATPAANGASALLSASSAVITGGLAGIIAEPDNANGSYVVVASTSGLSASFNLTNAGPVYASLVVNTTSDSLFPGTGLLSLREAAAFANDDRSGIAAISFSHTVFNTPKTINLTGGQLELSNTSEAETITGPTAGVTVNGGGLSRVFQIDGGVMASISGLTITSGKSANSGGGVDNLGTLALTNCTVSGNSASNGNGGGVQNSGTLALTNCTVSGNAATSGYGFGNGGGGVANTGTLALTNCTVSGNSTNHGGGGGVFNNHGSLSMTNCNVTGNSALFGGGVDNSGALSMTNCTLSGNSATTHFYGGGGLFNDGSSTATLTNCTLTGNSASYGGGLYNWHHATATLTNCTVSGNSAGGGGGVWNAYSGTATLTNCTVSANSARGGGVFGLAFANGGGVLNFFNSTIALTNCTISGNFAAVGGGGMSNAYLGTATLTNCTIRGNIATNDGGGMDNLTDSTAALTNCTVSGNSAVTGGGIKNLGTLNVGNTIVAGNTASTSGPDALGTIASLGHNLIGKTDGSSGWVSSDLTGTSAAPLNPLLAPLGNYGGPTQTMYLLPGSPAINAGSNALIPAGITTDQRGLPRIANGIVDIGAVESQGSGAMVFGTALYLIGGNTNDQLNITPIGTSQTGSTGIHVQGRLNNVNINHTYTQAFTNIYVIGFSGNENIQFAASLTINTTVTAGNGNDHVTLDNGNNTVMLGNGNDNVQVGNDDNWYNNWCNDDQTGTGSNSVTLGNGNDNVRLSNGSNSVTLGNGNDHVQAGDGSNTVNVGNGNDYVQLGDGNNTVAAGTGNDWVQLGNGNNNVMLGNGNDIIQAGHGSNSVTAGNGNDHVELGNECDGWFENWGGNGPTGNNSVTLGNGNDHVQAGDGNNHITVGNGNDTVQLGDGNNVIQAGTGNDNLQAGDGTNTVTAGAPGSTANIHIQLGNGANNIVTLVGNGNDHVQAGNGGGFIVTIAGNGNDQVQVGNGNGDSVMIVGNGNENVQVGNGTGDSVAITGNGNETVRTGNGSGSLTILGTGQRTLHLGNNWTHN